MTLPIVKNLNYFESLFNIVKKDSNDVLTTIVIKNNVIEANKKLAVILKIPIATEIYELQRLRFINNHPMTIEHLYIPWNYVKGIGLLYKENLSFHDLLKHNFKFEILNCNEEIIVNKINHIQIELLKTSRKELPMIKCINDYSDNMIEYSENIFLPELYRFQNITG
ncbi:UTRA domain-containing protein [Bombilactobacillus bombi]|uniref:UTRA domain-containing protein n=1 Tax=Bombilactobacillus bombi TaxID=1303590 RepID=UPI0015E61AD9|nr:UTRA domain-containing protein [Bombilactobacillus bombi]MBA1433852.1 UTRA domain-containing protein [Bombilactobacillus bombi]